MRPDTRPNASQSKTATRPPKATAAAPAVKPKPAAKPKAPAALKLEPTAEPKAPAALKTKPAAKRKVPATLKAKPAAQPKAAAAAARRPHAPRLPRLTIAPVRPRERAEALLDRIVRGRAWIPVLAVLLVGIVAMQVEVLKLGASVGRSASWTAELQGQNEVLQNSVSELQNPERIEKLAGAMGLVQPGPTDLHFESAGTSVAQAIRHITPVDHSTFETALAQQQADDATAAQTPASDATSTTTPASSDSTDATSGATDDTTAPVTGNTGTATPASGNTGAGATTGTPDA